MKEVALYIERTMLTLGIPSSPLRSVDVLGEL